MAQVYGQIHYGEVLGLSVAAKAIAQAPELWVKLFGATQLMDEARHVEFFGRVMSALGTSGTVVSALEDLGSQLFAADSIEEMMLGTHIILEGFAQRVFVAGARQVLALRNDRVRLPGSEGAALLLRSIDTHVGRDEGRHLAFGVMYLRERFRHLAQRERSRLAERAQTWGGTMIEIVDKLASSLRVLGTSADALRAGVEAAQKAQFRAIGIAPLEPGRRR
jgi:hypothetical protein